MERKPKSKRKEIKIEHETFNEWCMREWVDSVKPNSRKDTPSASLVGATIPFLNIAFWIVYAIGYYVDRKTYIVEKPKEKRK